MGDGLIGMAVGGIIGFMLGALLFVDVGVHNVKVDAVKAGAAEWTISKDGERGFRWVPAAQPEAK